jgi:hypothetical protein
MGPKTERLHHQESRKEEGKEAGHIVQHRRLAKGIAAAAPAENATILIL